MKRTILTVIAVLSFASPAVAIDGDARVQNFLDKSTDPYSTEYRRIRYSSHPQCVTWMENAAIAVMAQNDPLVLQHMPQDQFQYYQNLGNRSIQLYNEMKQLGAC